MLQTPNLFQLGGRIAPLTTNPVETKSERIGALYFSNLPGTVDLTCTANYLGGKFWLTAHHCVDGKIRTVGFIEQSDGQFAGIEAIYKLNNRTDIALIKVGSGIQAEQFTLPTRRVTVGSNLEVVGYAAVNPFSSRSTMKVTGVRTSVSYNEFVLSSGQFYDEVFTAVPSGELPYAISGGDSGAAVYSGNTVFGVVSGGTKYNSLKTQTQYHADVYPHVGWISNTMANSSHSNALEIYHSFRGGLAQKYLRLKVPSLPLSS